MFEDLSEKLEATFARLRGRGVLTEADIKEGLREVRRVLLEADVNFQLTREFLERVEKRATGVNALSTVSPGQQLVKIVHEELAAMLGETREGLKLGTVPPSVIMMVGLQGSGKTTTAAKLARKLKAEGRSTRLIAADVYRPAAIDQLETLGRDLSIPVYSDRSTNDVVRIARAGVAEALRERDRVVILDTAGRLQIDDAMMQELRTLKEALHPSEILLVADGMTGQDAVKIAQGFDQALHITGVVLTKIQKMGPLEGILKMLPGVNTKALKQMKADPKRMKHVEAIVLSMTPGERKNPGIINGSRRARIAKGAGRPISDVNRLLDQFREMQKMMKKMAGGGRMGIPSMPGMFGMR